MSKTLKLSICLIVTLFTFCLFSQHSSATIAIFGDGVLGDFEGQMTYSASNATNGILTIILKNTSPVANGGYITAFLFNNPGNRISGVTSFTPTDTDFYLMGGPTFNNSLNGSPFGQFDIGTSSGGGFGGQGDQNPNKGIAVGVTETFTFAFTGTGLDTLDENSFFSELSSGNGAGEGYKSFVVRFRGFEDGGSDKVPGNIVPEPASLSILGLGLVGFPLGQLGRKKR